MVEQGDILKIEGIKHRVIVVSKNKINESGRIIVCPMIKPTTVPSLSILIEDGRYAICDTVRQLDIEARRYAKKGRIPFAKLIIIIDMIQSMLDYF